ncbi:hypothetical protein HYT23_01355 [Candidatus Pacearchaeota archaeon]|nr:hypothetical protein [Candidatus Pacearchaeota archaeon]
MVDIGELILSSVLTTIVNIFIGIALTSVLVEFGLDNLVSTIWMLLMAGIPLEVLVALGLIKNLS